MNNVQETIISQYAQSPTICRLIDNLNDYIDLTENIQYFLQNIWSIDTAGAKGLDIWGKIVGVSRLIKLVNVDAIFGFDDLSSYQPFNQVPFYSQMQDELTALDNETYRNLILIKALANISNSTPKALNLILSQIFPGITCYVIDHYDMTATYVFTKSLTQVQYAILTQTGILPKPAGVHINILQLDTDSTFGFNNTELQPFDQGTFLKL